MSHSVTSILSQIRSYQTQMGQPALNPLGETRAATRCRARCSMHQARSASFTETLRGAIAGVNDAQQKSGALAKAFEMGDPSADLAKVMVASQQSQIAFRWKSATSRPGLPGRDEHAAVRNRSAWH